MGTNYYFSYDVCECCGRGKIVHVGKGSFGWQFSFRGYVDDDIDLPGFDIRSFADWKKLFAANPNGKLTDQYGDIKTMESFEEYVREKLTQEKKKDTGDPMRPRWFDEEGFTFCGYDFS